MNPFITTGYLSPEYFCNRVKETKRLKTAIENNSNVTLLSIRRIGKTGLIKHVYHSLQKRNLHLIYIDIAHTNSLMDFISLFSNSILKKFQSKPERFFKELGSLLKNLRPLMKFDSKTGEPEVSVTFEHTKDAQNSLESIFDYLKNQSKKNKICIAIDEFQQVVKYPETNMEALLRSYVQDSANISFVFSGSKNSMMQNIFFNAKRPFYQSTEPMFLEKIDNDSYFKFIKDKFNKEGFSITDETIKSILNWTCTHTYYVQYFCYKLFTSSKSKVVIDDFYRICDSILEENDSIYLGYKNILSDSQWNLLRAIAKQGSVEKPTSIDFIKKYSLVGASSVNYLIKKLLEDDMIYEEKGIYYIYDVFFFRWLEKL
ncbi:MAG: ATP-binding protein [Ignavibacteriae bacterium]|nr:MAG: ATP-binding protein [Ignavibacteriota bacterium]